MDTEKWLTSKQAAEHIGYSEHALRRSRMKGGKLAGEKPPKFTKKGCKVRYKQSDLDKWMTGEA